jgi:competence protein ComEC
MLPLFWIAVAFTAGILFASLFPGPVWVWGILCLCLLVWIILSTILTKNSFLLQRIYHALKVSLPVLLFFLALGGMRYAWARPAWTDQNLAWYNDHGSYTLVAVIDKSPDRREDAVYFHVQIRELYDSSAMTYKRISGSALVRMDANSPWQLGDLLRFSAGPKTPSATQDFSYRAYLERQGVYSVIYHPTSVTRIASAQVSKFALGLEWLRQNASRSIFTIFPQPESGLMAGILLGNDNDLPQSVKQAYQDTGTAHIIAISGFNMAILAGLFLMIFSRIMNRYWAGLLSMLLLAVYAAFVGGSPSVVRAAIMAYIAFFGHLVGRKGGGMNALGLAAGLMLAVNPLLLWDASFQLSFAATAGLVLFAGPLQIGLEGFMAKHFSEQTAAQFSGPVSEFFLFSLAAQVTTLPVITMQFRRISLTSLLANPLVLPVQEVILVAGGAAAIAGMVIPVLGKVLAALIWPALAYSNQMVEWLDKIPNGVVNVSGRLAVWISVGGILIIMLAVIRIHFKQFFKHIKFTYLILILTAAAALIWSAALRQPDGLLHLSLLRAEEGTALYIQSPDGQTLLIDPGGSPNTLASQLSQTVSPWNFHIDAALLTRADAEDSLANLNSRLPVNLAILAPNVYQVVDAAAPLSLPEGMQSHSLQEGDSIKLGENLLLQPIASDNDHTAILVIYGQARILIPGGINPGELKEARSSSLRGLSALILNDEDVVNLPADMWGNFGAQEILWNSTSISPNPKWRVLQTLNSDGNKFWFN